MLRDRSSAGKHMFCRDGDGCVCLVPFTIAVPASPLLLSRHRCLARLPALTFAIDAALHSMTGPCKRLRRFSIRMFSSPSTCA